MLGPADRAHAVLDRLLRDPPVVHAMDFSANPELGLWSTDPDCYAFLADNTRPGTRSLETGAGLSTVLFAALGARHTCVTPSKEEADRVMEYCRTREIDTSAVVFALGRSDEILPRLEGDLDVVFVDGNHGFPAPVIDWFYAGGRLVAGGLFVLDDIQLPAVAHLTFVLDRDPGWAVAPRSRKWSAWRRLDGCRMGQDWFDQRWLPAPLPTDPVGLAKRVWARARRATTRARP
jgi:predicted O-methyltransferase YrrM